MTKHFSAALLAAGALVVVVSRRGKGKPAWIARSDQYTQQLLVAEAQFNPESAAQAGSSSRRQGGSDSGRTVRLASSQSNRSSARFSRRRKRPRRTRWFGRTSISSSTRST